MMASAWHLVANVSLPVNLATSESSTTSRLFTLKAPAGPHQRATKPASCVLYVCFKVRLVHRTAADRTSLGLRNMRIRQCEGVSARPAWDAGMHVDAVFCSLQHAAAKFPR